MHKSVLLIGVSHIVFGMYIQRNLSLGIRADRHNPCIGMGFAHPRCRWKGNMPNHSSGMRHGPVSAIMPIHKGNVGYFYYIYALF